LAKFYGVISCNKTYPFPKFHENSPFKYVGTYGTDISTVQ